MVALVPDLLALPFSINIIKMKEHAVDGAKSQIVLETRNDRL